jgi:hypothetical protein
VQYQLARNGEVVAAGGKVLTILDLQCAFASIVITVSRAS